MQPPVSSKRGRVSLETDAAGRHAEEEAVWSVWTQAPENSEPPEAGGSKGGPSSGACGGRVAPGHLDFRVLASRTVRKLISIVSPPICGNLLWQL